MTNWATFIFELDDGDLSCAAMAVHKRLDNFLNQTWQQQPQKKRRLGAAPDEQLVFPPFNPAVDFVPGHLLDPAPLFDTDSD